jgi:hypothetical protein
MKLYGIAWRRELPRVKLIKAAKRVAAEQLRHASPNKVSFLAAHGQKCMRRVRGLLGERERAFPSGISFEVKRSRCPHSRERLRFIGLRVGFAFAIV